MRFDSMLTWRTLSILIALALALVTPRLSCSRRGVMIGSNPQEEARHLAMLDIQPEAREWIRNNGMEGPLASIRFEGKEDALAFVNALYEAGAVKVLVYAINDDKIEMAQGGPYADALIVHLPADQGDRHRLMAIVDWETWKKGSRWRVSGERLFISGGTEAHRSRIHDPAVSTP